jgi:hypothetical protein
MAPPLSWRDLLKLDRAVVAADLTQTSGETI